MYFYHLLSVERRFPQLTMKKNAEGKLCAVKLDPEAQAAHRQQVELEARQRYNADMVSGLLIRGEIIF